MLNYTVSHLGQSFLIKTLYTAETNAGPTIPIKSNCVLMHKHNAHHDKLCHKLQTYFDLSCADY